MGQADIDVGLPAIKKYPGRPPITIRSPGPADFQVIRGSPENIGQMMNCGPSYRGGRFNAHPATFHHNLNRPVRGGGISISPAPQRKTVNPLFGTCEFQRHGSHRSGDQTGFTRGSSRCLSRVQNHGLLLLSTLPRSFFAIQPHDGIIVGKRRQPRRGEIHLILDNHVFFWDESRSRYQLYRRLECRLFGGPERPERYIGTR